MFSVYTGQTTIHFGSNQAKIISGSKILVIIANYYQELEFLGKRLLSIAGRSKDSYCASLGAGEACRREPIIFSCNNVRLLQIKRAFRDHAQGTCASVRNLRGSDLYFCNFCLGVPSCHIPGSYQLISPI